MGDDIKKLYTSGLDHSGQDPFAERNRLAQAKRAKRESYIKLLFGRQGQARTGAQRPNLSPVVVAPPSSQNSTPETIS